MTLNKTLAVILLLAILLGGALVLPPAAAAQEAITLDSVEIRVWPEFDRPSVLVIYSGSVAGTVDGPLDLRITLPPSVTVNAVAYLDSTTGGLLNAESAIDGQMLTLTTPNGSFHVEFYDPSIQIDGQTRAYSLSWESEYPINQLSWQIQQPAGASDMSIIPAPTDVGTDQFGLPVHFLDQAGIVAGRAATIVLEYSKPTDALTAEQLGLIEPGEGAEQSQLPAGGNAAGVGGWVWYVGGAVLVVAAAAGAYFFIVRRAPAPSRAKTSRAKPARQSASKKFCTQCGKPVEPGDVFCRHCGAKLK